MELVIARDGTVRFNGRQVIQPEIGDRTLRWRAQDNGHDVEIVFARRNTDPDFWPDGEGVHHSFCGTMHTDPDRPARRFRGTQAPQAQFKVNAQFIKTHTEAMPVSGGTEIRTWVTADGETQIYSISSTGQVWRFTPDQNSDTGWSEACLNVQISSRLYLFDTGVPGFPALAGLDATGAIVTARCPGPNTPYVTTTLDSSDPYTMVSSTNFLFDGGRNALYIFVAPLAPLIGFPSARIWSFATNSWFGGWNTVTAVPGISNQGETAASGYYANAVTVTAPSPIKSLPYIPGVYGMYLLPDRPLYGDVPLSPSPSGSPFVHSGVFRSPRTGDTWIISADAEGMVHVCRDNGDQATFTPWERAVMTSTTPVFHARDNPFGDGLQLFAVDGNGDIYVGHHVQGIWSTTIPLGIKAAHMALTNDDVFVVTPDGRLLQLHQDPATTDWSSTEIEIQSTDIVPQNGYNIEMSVLDQLGNVLPGQQVLVSSSEQCTMTIGNRSCHMRAGVPLTATANSIGRLTVEVPRSELGCPLITVTTDPNLPGLTIEPNRLVQDDMRGMTGDKMRNTPRNPLKGKFNTPETADSLAQVMQQSANAIASPPTDPAALRPFTPDTDFPGLTPCQPGETPVGPRLLDPATVPETHWQVEFQDGLPVYRALTAEEASVAIAGMQARLGDANGLFGVDWGDVWESVKEGASAIVEDIKDITVSVVKGVVNVAISVLIEGATYLWNGIMSAVEQVFDVIEGVLAKVQVFFENIVEWLAMIFDWENIKRTSQALDSQIQKVLPLIGSQGAGIQSSVMAGFDSFVTGLGGQITALDSQPKLSETVGAAEQQDAPPGTREANDHNLLLNKLVDNAESVTFVVDPQHLTCLRGQAADDLISELEKYSQNGMASSAVQPLSSFLSGTGDDPTKLDASSFKQFIDAIKALATEAISTGRTVLQGLLGTIAALPTNFQNFLKSMTLEIPFVSDFLRSLGVSIDLYQVLLMVIAAPATFIYSVMTGQPPFPAQQDVDDVRDQVTADSLKAAFANRGPGFSVDERTLKTNAVMFGVVLILIGIFDAMVDFASASDADGDAVDVMLSPFAFVCGFLVTLKMVGQILTCPWLSGFSGNICGGSAEELDALIWVISCAEPLIDLLTFAGLSTILRAWDKIGEGLLCLIGVAQAVLSGFLFVKENASKDPDKRHDALSKLIQYEMIFAPNWLIFLKMTRTAQGIALLVLIDIAFNAAGAIFQFGRASSMPSPPSRSMIGAPA